jgi:hypothetical protein
MLMHRAAIGVRRAVAARVWWASGFQGEAAGRSMAVPVNWRSHGCIASSLLAWGLGELGACWGDDAVAASGQTRQTCGRAPPTATARCSLRHLASSLHHRDNFLPWPLGLLLSLRLLSRRTCDLRHVNPASCSRRASAWPASHELELAPIALLCHARLNLLAPSQKTCPRSAADAGLQIGCPRDQGSQTRDQPHQGGSRDHGSAASRAESQQQGAAQGGLGNHERNVPILVAQGQHGNKSPRRLECSLARRRKAAQRPGSLLFQEHCRLHEYRLRGGRRNGMDSSGVHGYGL